MKPIFFVILLVLSVISGTRLHSNHAAHQKALEELNEIRQVYNDLDANCRDVRQQIISLKNSPAEVERVARESLGWCRDGEDVYHFSQSM